jgi:hypothetical protein
MDMELRGNQKHERDRRHRARLAEQGVAVGRIFRRYINQADRVCRVFAVKGSLYAFDYEMPAGAIIRQIGDTRTQAERTVSFARLPQWARV